MASKRTKANDITDKVFGEKFRQGKVNASVRFFKSLTDMSKVLHRDARDNGWYPDADMLRDDETLARNLSKWCVNIHGEVSELWEAFRNGTLYDRCDKPIDLTCAEEELADIVIRALDTAAAMGVDIGKAVSIKSEYNLTRGLRHGGKKA